MSQAWMFSQSSCLAAGTRCCCPRLALQLTVTVPLGKGLACLRFACALRAPFTDLQGYNSLGQFCLSAIVLQSLMLCPVAASPGAFTAGLELPQARNRGSLLTFHLCSSE